MIRVTASDPVARGPLPGETSQRPKCQTRRRDGPPATERARDIVTIRDRKTIEQAEERAVRDGAPREKSVAIEAMTRARD